MRRDDPVTAIRGGDPSQYLTHRPVLIRIVHIIPGKHRALVYSNSHECGDLIHHIILVTGPFVDRAIRKVGLIGLEHTVVCCKRDFFAVVFLFSGINEVCPGRNPFADLAAVCGFESGGKPYRRHARDFTLGDQLDLQSRRAAASDHGIVFGKQPSRLRGRIDFVHSVGLSGNNSLDLRNVPRLREYPLPCVANSLHYTSSSVKLPADHSP